MTYLGILTSGGDAPGMNAVIAGACEEAERLGANVYAVESGFLGLSTGRARRIGRIEARSHEHQPGTWLGTSRWPAMQTDEGRRACVSAAQRLGLDGLLVIGGNGSALGARALARDLPVAFIPATIDRDIAGTDETVGMDSAVGYAVDTIDRLRITGRALPGRAFLLQTLGSPNGHLAEAVALAAGIDQVLVPERPYDLEAVAAALRAIAASEPAIAVMSEAIGDAARISSALAELAGIRVHPTILGHAQRAASPSARDRCLGRAAGRTAVLELFHGRSCFVSLSFDGAAHATPLVARPTALPA
jgi:6-phosphofructokinase 1